MAFLELFCFVILRIVGPVNKTVAIKFHSRQTKKVEAISNPK